MNTRYRRPIYGASDIDLRSMSVHSVGGPDRVSSRDPNSPGLLWEGNRLELAPPRLGFLYTDAPSSWLEVDSLSDGGFWGAWDSQLGLIRFVGDLGEILPNPHGTFCAMRTEGREARPGLGRVERGRPFGIRSSMDVNSALQLRMCWRSFASSVESIAGRTPTSHLRESMFRWVNEVAGRAEGPGPSSGPRIPTRRWVDPGRPATIVILHPILDPHMLVLQ